MIELIARRYAESDGADLLRVLIAMTLPLAALCLVTAAWLRWEEKQDRKP